jgi:L-serine dehydratase
MTVFSQENSYISPLRQPLLFLDFFGEVEDNLLKNMGWIMTTVKNSKKVYQPVSLFQLFSIGIGPSSSHTVGPMRASYMFAKELEDSSYLDRLFAIRVELFGSLAMTGKGHATDIAVLLGLLGDKPELIDPSSVDEKIAKIQQEQSLSVLGKRAINFDVSEDLIFSKGKRLPYHSNAMKCRAFDGQGKEILSKVYYSVGGGFVVSHESIFSPDTTAAMTLPPFPFTTCHELLTHCKSEGKKIYEIVLANEMTWRSKEEIIDGIMKRMRPKK